MAPGRWWITEKDARFGIRPIRMKLSLYVAEVSGFPWPHGLFRCTHTRRFDAALSDVPDDPPEAGQRIIEAVARSLSADDLRRCDYHRPDWVLAAQVAIDCWRSSRREDLADVGDAISRAGLSPQTQWAAESFFIEPIWINGPSLGNGQHRVCAMKLAGVGRCLVER
jgi:hypothetical protein